MKILMINHFPLTGSGSGVNTLNIAKSLVKAGNEVAIIMPDVEAVEEIPGIKLHPVYFKTARVNFNFPCFTTHPRSHNTFYNLTDEEYDLYKEVFKEAIEEEIANFEPDIIHSGHIWTLSNVASKYDIPVVITAHGTDLIGLKHNDMRYIKDACEAYDSARAVIAISEDNADLVRQTFPGDEKVHLIPNGYDADIFRRTGVSREDILKKYGITKKFDKVVSFAGKFTEIKGIDTLLLAAKIYSDADTLTILAGNGELFLEFQELSSKLGLQNVAFLGNLAPCDLQAIFETADVSVVPSRSEAFGLVAIEAMACGTPVVASRVGGLVNILNEDVGSLVDVDDVAGFAKAIKMWLDLKDRVDSSLIAKYAQDNYSQDNFVNKLLDIYRLCIDDPEKKI